MKKEPSKVDMSTEKKTKPAVRVQKIKDLEGKFLLVRVGTPDLPATSQQIQNVQDQLIDLLEENNINCVAFVTHHAIEMEVIEKRN